MRLHIQPTFSLITSFLLSLIFSAGISAQDKQKVEKVQSSDAKQDQGTKVVLKNSAGELQMTATSAWKKVQPRSRIIEVEFSIPGKEKGATGRLTMMGAGGSIDANIKRWEGQFKQPDDSETKAKITEKEIAEQDVTIVDIAGTYLDRPIPVRPENVTEREGYRMLSAIIETSEMGNYFVKFYGPQETVAKNEKAFMSFINSLKVKEKN
jgi:hypothetical protein